MIIKPKVNGYIKRYFCSVTDIIHITSFVGEKGCMLCYERKRDSTRTTENIWVKVVGRGVCTGLVAWLVVTFSPTIHPYCSQSYLGIMAFDK